MPRLMRRNAGEVQEEKADQEFERFWAHVNFERGDKRYSFFTTIPDLCKGDRVVVQTKQGLGIGTFVSYTEPNQFAYNWIIQKIDMTEYHRNLRIWGSYK